MAFLKWHFRVLQVSSVLSIVALNSAASHPSYCSNNSVSCSSQVNGVSLLRLFRTVTGTHITVKGGFALPVMLNQHGGRQG
jgi:hypothetical protein